ncbi:MAG: glycoside hydrolase family 65 protein, partial [Alistipes sp.]|nr:glycoside hydrolase family 65 protein [Alistipes sp.]
SGHESLLSTCVVTVLAAQLGLMEKAYELYLRTARLDLDDYNREVEEGCHVTSMAGSWLAVVEGFGGMRVCDGVLSFEPHLPAAWQRLAFRIDYRGRVLSVEIVDGTVSIVCEGEPVEIMLAGERLTVDGQVSRSLK